MSDNNTSTSIASLLNLEALTHEEQAGFLEEVGTVIMESSTLRYLADISPEDQDTFVAFTASYAESPDLLDKLFATFPDFATIMTEEVAKIQADMQAIFAPDTK